MVHNLDDSMVQIFSWFRNFMGLRHVCFGILGFLISQIWDSCDEGSWLLTPPTPGIWNSEMEFKSWFRISRFSAVSCFLDSWSLRFWMGSNDHLLNFPLPCHYPCTVGRDLCHQWQTCILCTISFDLIELSLLCLPKILLVPAWNILPILKPSSLLYFPLMTRIRCL